MNSETLEKVSVSTTFGQSRWVGGKRKGEKVVDGAVVDSSKKKLKLAEAASVKKTITVDKKPNKEKKSGKAPTAVEAAR